MNNWGDITLKIYNRILSNESDMLSFGMRAALAINERSVLFLSGPLGVGKTTFVRGLLKGLDYTGKVKSPTYTLIETYEMNNKLVAHVDLYRIKNDKELEGTGLTEQLALADVSLIEWPIENSKFLPPSDLHCLFTYEASKRLVQLKVCTKTGEMILSSLSFYDE